MVEVADGVSLEEVGGYLCSHRPLTRRAARQVRTLIFKLGKWPPLAVRGTVGARYRPAVVDSRHMMSIRAGRCVQIPKNVEGREEPLGGVVGWVADWKSHLGRSPVVVSSVQFISPIQRFDRSLQRPRHGMQIPAPNRWAPVRM